jgi:hypothetical protein
MLSPENGPGDPESQVLEGTSMKKVIALLTLVPLVLHAQGQLPTDWSVIETIPPGDRIVLELTSGKKIKARFFGASETELTISRNSSVEALAKSTVSRVFRMTPRSARKSGLIGLAIGGGSGTAFGVYAYRQGDFVPSVIPFFGLIGAGIGALIGVIAGSRYEAVLIYTSIPASGS